MRAQKATAPIPGMRPKGMRPLWNCLASMVHPILQSIAETEKLERFFLNKKQTLLSGTHPSGVPASSKLVSSGAGILLKEPFPEARFSVYVFVLWRFSRLSLVTETLNYGVTWADLSERQNCGN